MLHLTKKRAAVAAVVGSLALGAGAIAYFTSTGTGSGSATTGTSVAFDVVTDAAVGDPLTPDGPSQTVAYHVTNPGSGNQLLHAVEVSIANSDGSPWNVGTCNAADFKLNGLPAGAPVLHVPHVTLTPGQTHDNSISIQMTDTGDNQDDCKNVTVPLYLEAS